MAGGRASSAGFCCYSFPCIIAIQVSSVSLVGDAQLRRIGALVVSPSSEVTATLRYALLLPPRRNRPVISIGAQHADSPHVQYGWGARRSPPQPLAAVRLVADRGRRDEF